MECPPPTHTEHLLVQLRLNDRHHQPIDVVQPASGFPVLHPLDHLLVLDDELLALDQLGHQVGVLGVGVDHAFQSYTKRDTKVKIRL